MVDLPDRSAQQLSEHYWSWEQAGPGVGVSPSLSPSIYLAISLSTLHYPSFSNTAYNFFFSPAPVLSAPSFPASASFVKVKELL